MTEDGSHGGHLLGGPVGFRSLGAGRILAGQHGRDENGQQQGEEQWFSCQRDEHPVSLAEKHSLEVVNWPPS